MNYAENITIEDHVWLAAHVTVLKGVVIGHDSVIGSGSVVTASIPPNSIAAGVPAKGVRSGVTWLAERITDRNATT